MQDEHPPAGQGPAKLCLRPATACDPAFGSGHFRLKVSLLSGNHKRNITLASKMSYSTTNFAKGSVGNKLRAEMARDVRIHGPRHRRIDSFIALLGVIYQWLHSITETSS